MNNDSIQKPLSEDEEMLIAGYVLGDLNPEELTRLEHLVEDDPQLLEEMHAMQTSFDLVPQGLAMANPPKSLREKIVLSETVHTVSAVDESQKVSSTQPVSTRRLNQRFLRIIAGLGVLAALMLFMDNLRLRNQLQLAEKPDSARVAAILQQPNSRLIAVNGNNSDAAGTLLFTPGNWQEVIVSLGNLPPLPPDEIYRMWLELENGQVIYCGEFNTDEEGEVFIRFTPSDSPPKGVKATELFVTIDDRNAEPTPSGERIMEGLV